MCQRSLSIKRNKTKRRRRDPTRRKSCCRLKRKKKNIAARAVCPGGSLEASNGVQSPRWLFYATGSERLKKYLLGIYPLHPQPPGECPFPFYALQRPSGTGEGVNKINASCPLFSEA
ncbi:hypothetical protein CDAR_621251 [Caerostris darwini]|uniref:Uncharacterized protein n=1 Tax=Caerostris darwini TaxID=1538125 RepID=A0AAV4RN98_9ARAC|nr:hypothetical protein CDAR_621251 [Caerostris darwini]